MARFVLASRARSSSPELPSCHVINVQCERLKVVSEAQSSMLVCTPILSSDCALSKCRSSVCLETLFRMTANLQGLSNEEHRDKRCLTEWIAC